MTPSPTTPRRDAKGHFLPAHNHLDQQVRPEGECKACDHVWAVQRERLSKVTNSPGARIDITAEREAARRAKAKAKRTAGIEEL